MIQKMLLALALTLVLKASYATCEETVGTNRLAEGENFDTEFGYNEDVSDVGNYIITKQQVNRVLAATCVEGAEKNNTKLDLALKNADTNKDGKVTVDEAFSLIDDNKNRFISFDELTAFIGKVHHDHILPDLNAKAGDAGHAKMSMEQFYEFVNNPEAMVKRLIKGVEMATR